MKTFSQVKCTPALLALVAASVCLHTAPGQGSTLPTPVTDFRSRWVEGNGSGSINDAVVVGSRGVFVGYREKSSNGSWDNLPVVVRTDDGLDVKRLDLQPTIVGASLNTSGDYELRAVAYGNGQWMALGRDGNWENGSRVWRSKDNAVTWSDSTQQGGVPIVEKISGMGQYWGLAYGNGTWVAVGYQDYSSTGIISYLKEPAQNPAISMWQSAMLPMGADAQASAALRKVCFGNGTFVAIGDKGAIYTSVDGQDWVERSSGVTEDLHGVAYGNGIFVVVGKDGSALVSKNSGQSWTRFELPVGGGQGIAFDGTLFGVEGSGGFAVSRDGEIWLAGGDLWGGGSAYPEPLAGSANLGWLRDFRVTSFSQSVKGYTPYIKEWDISLIGQIGKALTSYKITTWDDASAQKPTAFRAFGLPPGLTLNATTGVISGTPTASGNYKAVVYAGNANGFGGYESVFFTIAKSGYVLPTPVKDFRNRWVGGNGSGSINDALVEGGRGVFVGYREKSSNGSWDNLPVVVRTDDGLDVKRLDLQPTLDGAVLNNSGDYELRAVAYGNGQWMALGRDGNWDNGSRVWRSKDNAVTWSDSSQQGGVPMVEKISGMGQYWGLAYGNGIWVAVGYEDSASAKGIISYLKEPAQNPAMSMWQSAMLPMGASAQTAALRKVCFGNGTFVAIGDTGAIHTSVDGHNWVERNSGVTEDLHGVAYGNGGFVVVGKDGSALVSKNSGQSWTRSELPVGGGEGIAFDGTLFGVEGSGGFAVSRDGEIWVAGDLSSGGSASPEPLAGSANLGWLRYFGVNSFYQSVKGNTPDRPDEPESSLLGEVGKTFTSYQITTWDYFAKATVFRASGLPPGLVCNASTGLISGTPTTPGSYMAVVYAGNANGFGYYTFFSFTIAKPGYVLPTSVTGFRSRWVGGSGSKWFNDALAVGIRGVVVGYYQQESALGSWGNLPVVLRTDDGLDVKRLDLQPTLDGAALNNSGDYELRAVAYGNGQWMALGRDGNWDNGSRVWRSKDNAVTWSDSSQQGGVPMVEKISGMGQYWGLAYGNGIWVAVGYEDSASAKGIISYLKEPAQNPAMSMWQSAMLPMGGGAQAAALRKVCFGNGTFVAIGDKGAICTSVDGQNWAERSSGVMENLHGVAYGNGIFVVVGKDGSALVSKNSGQSWTRFELPVGGGQGIAFDGTLFGVEGSGGFAVSRDGEVWVVGDLSGGGSASPSPLAASANLGWLTLGGSSFSQSVKGATPTISEPDSSLIGEVGKAFVNYQIQTDQYMRPPTPKATSYRGFELPPGLTLNATTGVISGTPTASGNYRALVYAGNANGFGDYEFIPFAISPPSSNLKPILSTVPQALPSVDGPSITLFIAASSATPMSYEWYLNGQKISGATSASHVLQNASVLLDGSEFYVKVTNSSGTTTSSKSILKVAPDNTAPMIYQGNGLLANYTRQQPIIGKAFDSGQLYPSKPVQTYSASGLPSWASIDPYSGNITGTPDKAFRGRVKIFMTPYDGSVGMAEIDIYVAPDTDGDGLNDDIEDGHGRYLLVKGYFNAEEALSNFNGRFGEGSENRVNLASITSDAEWEMVKKSMSAEDLQSGFWLGGSKNATASAWKWQSGEAFSYTRWAVNRPSASSGSRYIFASGSGWIDESPQFVGNYLVEFFYSTNKLKADSDDDGTNDWDELQAGTNPVLPAPDISSPRSLTSKVGAPLSYAIKTTTPATGITVEEVPEWMTWDSVKQTLTGQPSTAGNYTAKLLLNGSGGNRTVFVNFNIAKAEAAIMINYPYLVYDGFPKAVSVSTIPQGLPFTITYNGSADFVPVEAGVYNVSVKVDDINYSAVKNVKMTISLPVTPPATWSWSPANTSTPLQIGGTAFFGVENVIAPGTISYQWLKNGKPLPGKTSSTLTLNSVGLADAGSYALVITTAAGKVTTESQKLVIENSGLAIYKLTGRGNWIDAFGRKPISFGGYILVDLTTMEGRGIFTMDHKTYGKYQTELSSSPFVMNSSGPWQGSTSLLSSVSGSEEAPAYEVISFSGMDALIALDKSKTILAPSTMAGFIHGYLNIAGTSGKALEVLTASLTLDKPQTLNASNSSETLEEAYNRLILELAIKGFGYGASSAGSGTPPRPIPIPTPIPSAN